jgi:cytochrome c553
MPHPNLPNLDDASRRELVEYLEEIRAQRRAMSKARNLDDAERELYTRDVARLAALISHAS